jgi:integrase
MASIHKDPRGKSPFWYCAYTLPGGQRAFKSTKKTDRTEAQEFCLCLDRASKLASGGNLTETRAKQLIGEIVERAGGEALTFRNLDDFCREWLESRKVTKAPSTHVRYAGIVNSFLAFLGEPRAKMSIASVAARDVQAFRDNEVRQGKSETSANLALKTLRSVFNTARRQGLITTNPAEAVETFAAEKEQRNVFTNEQLKALYKAAPPEWRTMILLGYNGGLRLSDCANLEWANVDFTAKAIRFSPQKTSRGKKRSGGLVIPLMPEVEAHLLSLPSSDNPSARLCPTLALKATGGNHGLSRSFADIMAAAGIYAESGEKKKGKGRVFKTLGFHSLRHNFVSELANADVPADVRQKISGHNSESVHARYTHTDIETKRRAMDKMRGITG